MGSIFDHKVLLEIILKRQNNFVNVYKGFFFVRKIVFVLSADYPEQIGFVEYVQFANIKVLVDFLEHVFPKYLVALFGIVLLQNA